MRGLAVLTEVFLDFSSSPGKCRNDISKKSAVASFYIL
jgi:hypothetical protein